MNYQHYKSTNRKTQESKSIESQYTNSNRYPVFLYAPSFRCVSTKSSTKNKGQIVEALASHHAIWPFMLLEHLRYSLFDESFLLPGLNYKLYHVSMSIWICSFDKLDTVKHMNASVSIMQFLCNSNGPNPESWNNCACWKMLNERHFFVIFTIIENLCGCRGNHKHRKWIHIVTSSLTSSLRLVIQQWFIRGLTYNEDCFANLSIYLLKICFK